MTPELALQAKIEGLEKALLSMPQVDIPMCHWIEGEYYYRAILVKAGQLITGARHRLEHECVCIGTMQVSTDVGMKTLSGYSRFWAQAGKKRVGLAITDVIWVTKHWTSQKTLDKIEEWLSFPEEHKALGRVRERRDNLRALQQSNPSKLLEQQTE